MSTSLSPTTSHANGNYMSGYCALQAHLRHQYRADLADMKSAIGEVSGHNSSSNRG